MTIGSSMMSGAAYASATYKSAVNNSIRANVNPGAVEAVKPVPKTFSNDETERIKKTPEENEKARNEAYEMMKAETARNAENINGKIVA